MSHSNFKLVANDEPINRNLVIIVNKNGDVGTDTLALQNLLTSRETPETGVTVIRETSPTPSISDEIEAERMQNIEMLRQQYIGEHPNASEEEIEQQMRKFSDDIPHVSLNVENFYTPDQARKFANDILHLGGIDNPSSLMPIDYNFRRQIVQNDHCYTPLTLSPKEPSSKSLKSAGKGSTKGKEQQQLKTANSNKKESKTKGRQQHVKEEEESSDSGDEDEEMEEEQSAEEEEISFSESDDDNDMDFSVNDRFGKKGKKKRKYRRHKQKSMTFKDFIEGGGEMSSMDDEPKKKYGKSSKKATQAAQRTSGKSIGPSTSKNTQQSTAIRKIPNIAAQNKNAALRKEIQPAVSNQVKPSTTNTTSSVIGQISIQSAAPAKSTQELEFVESIVKDLEKSFPENDKKAQTTTTTTSTNSIPHIMQIMDTNTPTEVIDQSLSTLEHIDGNVGIEEIGDAIIAALGNEAIDELLNQGDLMNFDSTSAAAAHIKPAHNIVSSSSATVAHTLLSTQSQPQLLSDISSSPLAASVSSPIPKILNKQAPIKDPIKVVRNGRVITLPPIEAPTTRGAKRRAQVDPISTSPPVTKIVKAESVLSKTPSIKDPDSRNSSRRSSLNKSESGRNSRRQSTAQAGNEDDENSDVSWNSEDDPDRLWCICKQPHNNRFMIACDKCEEWFHGTCVNVTKAMGKDMEKQDIKWHCPNCKSNAGAIKKDPNKKTLNQQKLTKFFSKNMKESTDEDVPKSSSNSSLMCAVCHKKPARTDSIYCSEDCIRNHATKHLDDTAQPKTPTSASNSAKMSDGKRGNVLKDQSGNVSVYDKTTGKLLSAKLWPHLSNLGQWLSQNPNCEPVKPGSHHANQLLSRSSKNSQAATATSPSTPTSAPHNTTVTSTSHTTATPTAAKHHHHHHHPPPIIPADELFSNPIKINTGAKETVHSPVLQKKAPTTPLSAATQGSISRSNSNTSIVSRPPLQKQSSVSSSTSIKSVTSQKSQQQESKKLKKQPSDEKPQATSTPSNSKSKIEYERMNVRNNLKSTLQQRMKEMDDSSVPRMNDEEVSKFATSIEHEMFRFFNKDTRDKYKVKFRSLKFNLSDTKNKTLIERICMKKLTPKQLVELPSSELASKELSKWREEENKHQLEIITKAELDALAQNKMVLKTHKGEEIIETKAADISLPDENDVESIIEKTVLSVEDPHHKYDLSRSISLNVSGNHSVSSPLSSPSISSSTGRKSDHHHHSHHESSSHHSRSRSKSRGREHHHREHHKSTSSSSSSKHNNNNSSSNKKSEHKHRSRSPKHHSSSHHHSRDKSKGSHSRDKSREKSREKSQEKEHHHHHHHHHAKHHRDKSKSNEKEKEKSSKSKDTRESTNNKKSHHHKEKETHHKEVISIKEEIMSPKEKKEDPLKIPEIKPEQEDVDIVGKILDSMGVHLDTKPIKSASEDEKTPLTEDTNKMSEVSSTLSEMQTLPISTEPVNEHQLEIEIYSGNMYMADVAKFDVTASVVSGNVDDIIKLFNPQMEIVGRIEPRIVWEYLTRVKRIGKELAILRFSSTDESAYFSLFSYLHSRQRYGVIKSPAPNIKDFYLITVEAKRPLPSVLLPIVGPGFIEGEEHKPDLLLGVILKITPETKHVHKKSSSMKKTGKKPAVEHIVPIQILPSKHKSHHSHGSSSSSSSKLTMGLPEFRSDDKLSPKKSPSSKDDDEPYTPFDEDDSLTPPRSYGPTSTKSATKLHTSDDLESQMEQINREIERRQMEIQTLAQQKALELNEEQASKIFEKISVPHNLSEILSTIKASSEPKPMEIDDDDDEEYVPIPANSKGGIHEYRASTSYPAAIQQSAPIVNSMMDIDERINLFRQEMPLNNLQAEQPSKLASMSDADLLALVPEEALQAPPPPMISSSNNNEPAIPGLEYEMEQ